MKRIRTVAAELVRRKVVRVVGIYLVVYAGAIATIVTIAPAFQIPLHWLKWPIVGGAVLIPVLATLAWRYEILPPQLIRDAQDAGLENRALKWVTARHDVRDAGYLLLSWVMAEAEPQQRRFFQPVSIGREPANDIELADPRVSRHHAVIWAEDGSWRVRDLESANGTFIDGKRVTGTAVLPAVSELRFHANGPTVSVAITKSPETQVS